MPSNLPDGFLELLNAFAQSVRYDFAAHIPANPEDQLKLPVQTFLREIIPNIHTRTEAQVVGLNARPDIGVSFKGLLCGFVELKAPGKGARPQRFTGADRAQWNKFKALPNLIYTDGTEWTLFRSGELKHGPLRLTGDLTQDGADGLNPEAVESLYAMLLDFLHWSPIVPNTPSGLAELLAPLCLLLREQVEEATSRRGSNLAALAIEWRQYLFPDADEHQFADAYAQTITYSLLLARLSGEHELNVRTAASRLDIGHGLLAQALRVLAQPGAREEIDSAVSLLERVIGAVNPTALTQRGDPWLYFYEDFLAAYDPVLRRKRGVYYTPMQVIKAKVRLVSQLLAEKFNKPLSFADDGVVFLDPAAGTAAYPLAAVEFALEKVSERFGPGNVPARATQAARNTHAFEFLVGPYAVAHLRMTQLILDAGGELPNDGVHVYLTDTLESPFAEPPQPNLYARRLTEEHQRAQVVKLNTPILVCMGNPPYEREQREDNPADDERKGGWVRHGDREQADNRPILQDFVEPATEAGAGVHIKNLYNDYVYFWRWALWKMFENPNATGPGIVAFITASSYLRGPGFIGMRRKMRESFDEIWIIDLEGGNLGARKTENVFAIQTPVAIAIGVTYSTSKGDQPACVHYSKVVGTRDEKLDFLDRIETFQDLTWRECYSGWFEPFLPVGNGDYFSWPLLTDVFPWQHSGVQFKRTWPIGVTDDLLRERWKSLLETPIEQRDNVMRSTDARTIQTRQSSFFEDELLPSIASLEPDSAPVEPARYAFRSFDRQWMLPDKRLCDRPRPELLAAESNNQIYLTSLLMDVLGKGPATTVCALVPDLHHFSGRGGKDVIPLYKDGRCVEPNVTDGLLSILTRTFRIDVNADNLFSYIYAVTASPEYTSRFSDEMLEPGPRVPITKNAELFQLVADAGRKLIWLHTFGERLIPQGHRKGEVPVGLARCTQAIPTRFDLYPEEYSYDEQTETLHVGSGLIKPVPSEIWNYEISGLFVVQSWLHYRMKSGAGQQRSPLDRIRPTSWTATMTEELLQLLWVLEATTEMYPQLSELLGRIVDGDVFLASELPTPTDDERRPPTEERDSDQNRLF